MKKRSHNPRLVKIHRSYTVDEISKLFEVHKNTVRSWIKQGLPTIGGGRLKLVHGGDLFVFIKAKRKKNKQTCKPGEIYCVRCRAPKAPAADMAEYQRVTETLGNLIGICPDCGLMMNRRVNLSKLEKIRGRLDITMPLALQHISESANPSVNCDLR